MAHPIGDVTKYSDEDLAKYYALFAAEVERRSENMKKSLKFWEEVKKNPSSVPNKAALLVIDWVKLKAEDRQEAPYAVRKMYDLPKKKAVIYTYYDVHPKGISAFVLVKDPALLPNLVGKEPINKEGAPIRWSLYTSQESAFWGYKEEEDKKVRNQMMETEIQKQLEKEKEKEMKKEEKETKEEVEYKHVRLFYDRIAPHITGAEFHSHFSNFE